MNFHAAALVAIGFVPACAFASLYSPGVEVGFRTTNRISGMESSMFGLAAFNTDSNWRNTAKWDGSSSDRSAHITETSDSTAVIPPGQLPPYSAISRSQIVSAYAQPASGRLGAKASNLVSMVQNGSSDSVSGYTNLFVWASIADNLVVTGAAPVEVTFQMRVHGTQEFADTNSNFQIAQTSMKGSIGVMPITGWDGAETTVRYDNGNPSGASVDQLISFTTLLQPGSTLFHADFEVTADITFNGLVTFDPRAISDGMNTGTFSVTVSPEDASRISSENGLLSISVPEPTSLSAAFALGMVLLKRNRRQFR